MAGAPQRSLDEQLAEFRRRRFVAMPIAGLVMWIGIALAGAWLPPQPAVLAVWVGTGLTFYLGAFLSKLTGEDFFSKTRLRNGFDRLFFLTLLQSLMVFAIAMPFASIEPSSVPMTVGILAGLMWIPFSWIVGHWVGVFHGVARTLLIVAAWFAFPGQRFVVIPCIVVGMYLLTIPVLELRWRRLQAAHG